MSAIVPFNFAAPAIAAPRRVSKINQDVMIGGAGFPVISIKGKVFTLVKDNERKVLTRKITDDDGNVEEMPISSLNLVVARANVKSRVFYAGAYVEGDSDGAKPTCFSHDGVAPDPGADKPQAKNCQLCPHAVWGSKPAQPGAEAKGTACGVNTRLAVVDPKHPGTAFLLRVPAGSRMNFNDAVKLADVHGKDYNQVVMKISFDNEAPSPKLKFHPVGFPSDEVQVKLDALFEDQVVRDIVGSVGAPRVAAPAGQDDAMAAAAAQAEAELAAKKAAAVKKASDEAAAVKKAAAEATAAALKKAAESTVGLVDDDELGDALGGAFGAPAETKPAPAAKKAAAKKAPAETPVTPVASSNGPVIEAGEADGLLGELGSLLGSKDD